MKKLITLLLLALTLLSAKAEKSEHVLLLGFQQIGWYPDVSQEIFDEFHHFLDHWGGDEAGNGGFAYEQSYMLIVMAAVELKQMVQDSTHPLITNFPKRRQILGQVFNINNIIHLPQVDDIFRNGRRLALDYVNTPPYAIKLYRPFYQRFMSTLPALMFDALKEVKKLFLHEAAHIWGFGESQARAFALELLASQNIEIEETALHSPTIKENFCICHQGESVALGLACNNFCAKTHEQVPTLHLEALLHQKDVINPQINDLYEWCFNELSSVAPSCHLQASDGVNSLALPLEVTHGSGFRQVKASLALLEREKIYLLNLVHSSGIASSHIQIQLLPEEIDVDPIETVNISNYHCVTQSGSITTDGNTATEQAFKNDFYFNPAVAPSALPPTFDYSFFFCHDKYTYGEKDSALYPRLDLKNNVFKLFNHHDIAFYDLNNNGIYDIEDQVQEDLLLEHNITMGASSLFHQFHAYDPLGNRDLMGFIMTPFIKTTKGLFQVFCPTQEHYNTYGPLLKSLGKYIRSETEALYLAQREAIYLTTPDGEAISAPENHIYIRENLLKKIWFYLKDGEVISATPYDAARKSIYFYWPANTSNPLQKHSYQSLYQIVSSHHHFNFAINAPDKRIGCVPKMMEEEISQPETGHNIGGSCTNDLQCDSLCCNSQSGKCAEHNPDQGLFCNKEVGQQCSAHEYCGMAPTTECKLYKTGTSTTGQQLCDIRCFPVQKQGFCINNQCQVPLADSLPDWNPSHGCAEALDYPTH